MKTKHSSPKCRSCPDVLLTAPLRKQHCPALRRQFAFGSRRPRNLVIRFQRPKGDASFLLKQISVLLTLSQVCCLRSPFDRDLEDFAGAGCESVEVWLTKLETYLEKHAINDVRYWLEKTRLTLRVASFQGGLIASQGEARREAWELFGRRLDLCR